MDKVTILSVYLFRLDVRFGLSLRVQVGVNHGQCFTMDTRRLSVCPFRLDVRFGLSFRVQVGVTYLSG
jgi:hypothetical protein